MQIATASRSQPSAHEAVSTVTKGQGRSLLAALFAPSISSPKPGDFPPPLSPTPGTKRPTPPASPVLHPLIASAVSGASSTPSPPPPPTIATQVSTGAPVNSLVKPPANPVRAVNSKTSGKPPPPPAQARTGGGAAQMWDPCTAGLAVRTSTRPTSSTGGTSVPSTAPARPSQGGGSYMGAAGGAGGVAGGRGSSALGHPPMTATAGYGIGPFETGAGPEYPMSPLMMGYSVSPFLSPIVGSLGCPFVQSDDVAACLAQQVMTPVVANVLPSSPGPFAVSPAVNVFSSAFANATAAAAAAGLDDAAAPAAASEQPTQQKQDTAVAQRRSARTPASYQHLLASSSEDISGVCYGGCLELGSHEGPGYSEDGNGGFTASFDSGIDNSGSTNVLYTPGASPFSQASNASAGSEGGTYGTAGAPAVSHPVSAPQAPGTAGRVVNPLPRLTLPQSVATNTTAAATAAPTTPVGASVAASPHVSAAPGAVPVPHTFSAPPGIVVLMRDGSLAHVPSTAPVGGFGSGANALADLSVPSSTPAGVGTAPNSPFVPAPTNTVSGGAAGGPDSLATAVLDLCYGALPATCSPAPVSPYRTTAAPAGAARARSGASPHPSSVKTTSKQQQGAYYDLGSTTPKGLSAADPECTTPAAYSVAGGAGGGSGSSLASSYATSIYLGAGPLLGPVSPFAASPHTPHRRHSLSVAATPASAAGRTLSMRASIDRQFGPPSPHSASGFASNPTGPGSGAAAHAAWLVGATMPPPSPGAVVPSTMASCSDQTVARLAGQAQADGAGGARLAGGPEGSSDIMALAGLTSPSLHDVGSQQLTGSGSAGSQGVAATGAAGGAAAGRSSGVAKPAVTAPAAPAFSPSKASSTARQALHQQLSAHLHHQVSGGSASISAAAAPSSKQGGAGRAGPTVAAGRASAPVAKAPPVVAGPMSRDPSLNFVMEDVPLNCPPIACGRTSSDNSQPGSNRVSMSGFPGPQSDRAPAGLPPASPGCVSYLPPGSPLIYAATSAAAASPHASMVYSDLMWAAACASPVSGTSAAGGGAAFSPGGATCGTPGSYRVRTSLDWPAGYPTPGAGQSVSASRSSTRPRRPSILSTPGTPSRVLASGANAASGGPDGSTAEASGVSAKPAPGVGAPVVPLLQKGSAQHPAPQPLMSAGTGGDGYDCASSFSKQGASGGSPACTSGDPSGHSSVIHGSLPVTPARQSCEVRSLQ